ncbi:MAG: hypothetical protein Q8R36_04465 [bacterium]|nr:hypothetical protein [bacterium]
MKGAIPMKSNVIKTVSFSTLLLFALSACTTPYRVACEDLAIDSKGEWKYTKQQSDVACNSLVSLSAAAPSLFGVEAGHGSSEDSSEKKKPTINLYGLEVKDVEKIITDQARDIDDFLRYDDRNFATTVDWLRGLRPGLEKQERVTNEILRRLKIARVLKEFTDKIGMPDFMKENKDFGYLFPKGPKAYSMRLLSPREGVSLENIPFTASYLEAAKKDGTLRLVDELDFTFSQTFAEKVPDFKDKNSFNWKAHKRGWVLKGYKIVTDTGKPEDNALHYIEIFRKKEDLTPEANPAARGFQSSGGNKVTVFLIFYNKEGELGYGSPDEVWETYVAPETLQQIVTDSTLREKLLVSLYKPPMKIDQTRPERQRPADSPIYTRIVKLGEVEIDVWQKGNWTVPFQYDDFSKTNDIAFVPLKPEDENNKALKDLKQIKLLVRTFKKDFNNRVIEYWKPKEKYSARNISEAFAFAETVRVRLKDQVEESAGITFFAERLVGVDYFSSGKWYSIRDKDGDGVFELKRTITEPGGALPVTTKYGEYSDGPGGR